MSGDLASTVGVFDRRRTARRTCVQLLITEMRRACSQPRSLFSARNQATLSSALKELTDWHAGQTRRRASQLSSVTSNVFVGCTTNSTVTTPTAETPNTERAIAVRTGR